MGIYDDLLQTVPSARQTVIIAVPLPEQVVSSLSKAVAAYPQYVEAVIPSEEWQLMLLRLENVQNAKQYYGRLMQPMPQSFVPTIRFTHVGRGQNREQLWAYAESSTVLRTIRQELIGRLRKMRFEHIAAVKKQSFVPHVPVAQVYRQMGGLGLADHATPVSFSWQKLYVYREEVVTKEALRPSTVKTVADSLSLRQPAQRSTGITLYQEGTISIV